MGRPVMKAVWVLGLAAALAGPLVAQQARIENAQQQSRPAPNLEREFRALVAGQAGPAWLGYAVPLPAGTRYSCCASSYSPACPLEGENLFSFSSDEPLGFKLEGATHLLVLFRAEQGRAHKLRTFTDDCVLDAGGLPVHWLTGVEPSQSVALLASFVNASEEATQEEKRMSSRALSAIALHADPTAEGTLDRFVAASQPESLRRRVASLLGARPGRQSFEILRRVVNEDPKAAVRQRAARSLTRSDVPEALDVVLNVARSDRSSQVRGRTLTYVAPKGGKKVADAIMNALQKDSSKQVKRRAITALGRLPDGQGVPLLIQVARTSQDSDIRKRALTQLGRSKDPRAVAFFEQVLAR